MKHEQSLLNMDMDNKHDLKIGDSVTHDHFGNGTEANTPAYFEGIIRTEFPQLTIRKDVPVEGLVGKAEDSFKLYNTRPEQVYKAEWGRPYDFVLYKDDKPVAVVMLGNRHSHNASVTYLISRMYAKKLKLPYINFYTQFPNTRDYVINRLHWFMNGGSSLDFRRNERKPTPKHYSEDESRNEGLWWLLPLIVGVISVSAFLIWLLG